MVRLTDRFGAAEAALSGSLGALARSVDDPALAPVIAGHAAQHAWHVELWLARRPVVAGTRSNDPLADGDVAVDLAHAYGEVVPGLLERARAWREATDASIDAPTARVLDLVIADLGAEVVSAAAIRR